METDELCPLKSDCRFKRGTQGEVERTGVWGKNLFDPVRGPYVPLAGHRDVLAYKRAEEELLEKR